MQPATHPPHPPQGGNGTRRPFERSTPLMSGGHAVVGPMCLEGPASTLVEVVDRALGMTARGDERPRIGLQHPEQVAKVGGVIVAGRFG